MSETVHYIGKLKPTGKTIQEINTDADDVYDLGYEEFVEINGLIYQVEKEVHNEFDDIFKATKNEDGTISFQVKYYNGGCGFNEAIDYAMDNIDV